ncbi:hypothetical protein [Paenibacillus hexagrammi]|uniref:Uncharacterized protein n=1 Tax=Paenibacillus hexagrammi TaxID=2908839 RepID=A0ABY3SQE1_9BACL|nr:hypothetical protein [Paenibacillus sp. YPD9-1]UJF35683.1 hypothetical protein L0M14_11685 [Paenibacillus sp. YPD9-1]
MNDTKYRKHALEIWDASRKETKQELLLELRAKQSKLISLFTNLKSMIIHKKSAH